MYCSGSTTWFPEKKQYNNLVSNNAHTTLHNVRQALIALCPTNMSYHGQVFRGCLVSALRKSATTTTSPFGLGVECSGLVVMLE